MSLWCYGWTCLFLIKFTHKITRLSWVWRSRLQVTQNLWQLVLQQYTDALVNHDIFCHDVNTDFPTISFPILWYCDTSWTKKIRHSEITIFYDSLPKPKPFVKQRDPCMQGKEVPSLLCIALCASAHLSFKMAAQKYAQFQLVVNWHSLVQPQTKHMVCPFFTAFRLKIVARCLPEKTDVDLELAAIVIQIQNLGRLCI